MKKFLVVQRFTERLMLIEFVGVFALSLLSMVVSSTIMNYILALLICALGVTTVIGFILSMIWLTIFLNEQVALFAKQYEEFLKANNK